MIPIAKPFLEKAEADAAREVVLSGWVSQGPQVAAFEREFAALVGAPHALRSRIAHGAAPRLARGKHWAGRRGDHRKSFFHRKRQQHPILRRNAGLRGYRSGHLQSGSRRAWPRRSRRARERSWRVHQMGMPCDLAALVASADRHGIALIEDAACAIGSQISMNGHWERIGKPHGRSRASPSILARSSRPAKAAC